jgi:hypothetical protein
VLYLREEVDYGNSGVIDQEGDPEAQDDFPVRTEERFRRVLYTGKRPDTVLVQYAGQKHACRQRESHAFATGRAT